MIIIGTSFIIGRPPSLQNLELAVLNHSFDFIFNLAFLPIIPHTKVLHVRYCELASAALAELVQYVIVNLRSTVRSVEACQKLVDGVLLGSIFVRMRHDVHYYLLRLILSF